MERDAYLSALLDKPRTITLSGTDIQVEVKAGRVGQFDNIVAVAEESVEEIAPAIAAWLAMSEDEPLETGPLIAAVTRALSKLGPLRSRVVDLVTPNVDLGFPLTDLTPAHFLQVVLAFFRYTFDFDGIGADVGNLLGRRAATAEPAAVNGASPWPSSA